MSRIRFAAAVLALLGLLALGVWWDQVPPEPVPAAQLAPAVVPVELPASLPVGRQLVPPAPPASAVALVPDPRLAPDWELSAAGLLESREWCTQAVRRARLEDEAEQLAALRPQAAVPAAEPDEVLEQAQRRAQLRWAQQLQALGSEAALALADHVLATEPLAQTGARERLQQRALRTAQGLVISLALQHAGEDKALQGRLARRWTELEPDNAAAWLAGGSVRPADQLLAGLQRSERWEDHVLSITQNLLELQQAPGAGLRDVAELQLLERLGAPAWTLPSWLPLIRHCQAATLARSCAELSERLWRLGSPWLLNRLMLVRLAAAQGKPGPQWQARADEAEGLAQWGRERPDVDRGWRRAAAACDPNHEAGPRLRAALAQGEWARLSEEFKHQPAAAAELAERRRQRTGKRMLSPIGP